MGASLPCQPPLPALPALPALPSSITPRLGQQRRHFYHTHVCESSTSPLRSAPSWCNAYTAPCEVYAQRSLQHATVHQGSPGSRGSLYTCCLPACTITPTADRLGSGSSSALEFGRIEVPPSKESKAKAPSIPMPTTPHWSRSTLEGKSDQGDWGGGGRSRALDAANKRYRANTENRPPQAGMPRCRPHSANATEYADTERLPALSDVWPP